MDKDLNLLLRLHKIYVSKLTPQQIAVVTSVIREFEAANVK